MHACMYACMHVYLYVYIQPCYLSSRLWGRDISLNAPFDTVSGLAPEQEQSGFGQGPRGGVVVENLLRGALEAVGGELWLLDQLH